MRITIHDPQKDDHIFSLPDLGVPGTVIPAAGVAMVTFVAAEPGIYCFVCSIPAHEPWMQGFITVLPDRDR